MAALKTLLTFILAGAFIGLAAASWAGPHFLEWYNTAPLGTQTVCDLPKVVQGVTSSLLRYQLIGTLSGAGVFFILGILFVVARSKKQKQEQQPPATPPQASTTA
ncbi:hypothetical protein [Vitiosangium sp. GDMCC 1.1324]|uniref:hypothetical protein n=1 Tax=Vitiosangium sp. (strain GDMCC 1.1324) TaxID=2138576 RepID=UPI000D36D663|nr:hypothetical protein [Vitiosangium sp. GDMCC 1.1324]PTL84367.1 hypothetical protein DAT35_04525 [Vitiosangium sp. GDMCC 1.1324]